MDQQSPLEAVLFDMDGTIVDTEPYWMTAEHALVEEHGGTWSDVHAHAIVGNALLDSARYIREHGPVDLEPAQIVDRLITDVVAATVRDIPWQPGARELLTTLAEHHVPCALVTMSYTALTTPIIDQLPVNTFAAVVTGDQVNDGKPHPEPYLTAMARLGVGAAGCVAIEDSPTGVASAEAAGCLVVAVPNHVPIEAAPGRIIVDSLTDLDPNVLSELVRRR